MENTLRNLQLVELEILIDVAKLCDANDITYYLDSGTLLGAMRHKGFIPWDDDVDICMDWVNYKKFVKLAPKRLSDKYFVQNYKTDPKACIRWTKIRKNGTTSMERVLSKYDIHDGVCIDIFVITGIANNKFCRSIQNAANSTMNILLQKYYAKAIHMEFSKKEKIIIAIVPEFLRRKFIFLLELIAFKDIKKTRYCTSSFFSAIDNPVRFLSEIFYASNKSSTSFEGIFFSIPSRWEECLKIYYNNWKQLPPEDERGGHNDVIIDLNNDYSLYKELGL